MPCIQAEETWQLCADVCSIRRYCVSQNPHIEAKIVEELARHGLLATENQPQPRELQYEDLSKLTYLNLVIKVQRSCLCVSLTFCTCLRRIQASTPAQSQAVCLQMYIPLHRQLHQHKSSFLQPVLSWTSIMAYEGYCRVARLSEAAGCVQESERMYPVAGGTVRMPKKDVVVGGQYVIPKDVTVFLPVSPAARYTQTKRHQPHLPACSVWPGCCLRQWATAQSAM